MPNGWCRLGDALALAAGEIADGGVGGGDAQFQLLHQLFHLADHAAAVEQTAPEPSRLPSIIPDMEEPIMPKYITIGYGDRAGYDRTPQDVRQAAHEHDASLKQRGVVMGIAETPVQVRNPDASGVRTETGPYLSSDLPIAGFSIMEAGDIDEAIALASKSPCAVAHGVIEVWPLKEA